MNNTYDFYGYTPYSAADLFAMNQFVEDDFRGNVTKELIRRGATWDEENKTLTVKGMVFPVQFVPA